MTETASPRQQLLAQYEKLPASLRAAAHWIIEHTKEVVLLSMREQAKRAGVAPSTMTRMAQRLGFDNYDDMRAVLAEELMRRPGGYVRKADALIEQRRSRGSKAIAAELIGIASAQIAELGGPEQLEELCEAANMILDARRTFIIGQRAGFAIAYQLAYITSLAGCNVQLLDRPGGIGVDLLRDGEASDVLVAISVHPYTRSTVEIAAYAKTRGKRIIAITDSGLSPLARLADKAILVGIESPSFFHTMSVAFVTVEALAALIASGLGRSASDILARSEAQFEAFDTYLLPYTARIRTRAGRRRHFPDREKEGR